MTHIKLPSIEVKGKLTVEDLQTGKKKREVYVLEALVYNTYIIN